jgi:hypothetical protein
MTAVPDIYRLSRIADGRSVLRAVAASYLATVKGVDPVRFLKKTWPRDEGAELILKASVSPTSTTSFPSNDQVGTLRSVAPGSAALKLFDAGVKFDLTGVTTVRVPFVPGLPTKAVFVGEGQPAPAIQFGTAAAIVGPARKVLVISGVTQELEEALPETASAVIGTVLANAANASLDKVAFDANPGDAVRPAGLLNGATPLTPSATADKYRAMSDDLSALAGAIGAAGIDTSDMIFVAGPAEATKIKIRAPELASNVLMTLGLPAKSVAAFAPSAIFSGYQDIPTVETSQETAIHWEDATPAKIVTTPGVKAAPVRSAFQTAVIAIRVRIRAAWAAAPGAA